MLRRGGWFGNSQGHSLAAKGVRLYPARRRQVLIDPVFYAKREQLVPFDRVLAEVRGRKTYQELRRVFPDADPESLRKKGIQAYEVLHADDTLSYVDMRGVDEVARVAMSQPGLRVKVLRVVDDVQGRSFLHPVKVESLKKRLMLE